MKITVVVDAGFVFHPSHISQLFILKNGRHGENGGIFNLPFSEMH
jgi:hypothetical protein